MAGRKHRHDGERAPLLLASSTGRTNDRRSSLRAAQRIPHNNNNNKTLDDLQSDCTFGTTDQAGIWWNWHDKVGCLLSSCVWIVYLYLFGILYTVKTTLSAVIWTTAVLALACHSKTTFTDPGRVPRHVTPFSRQKFCVQCQQYKPKYTHHCKICNCCVSRMDHHCPWTNNCIGMYNYKFFCLFLLYTLLSSVLSLCLMVQHWDRPMVRTLLLVALPAVVFCSYILYGVLCTIKTGLGTIDRLQNLPPSTLQLSDLFGNVQRYPWYYWWWLLPTDPHFLPQKEEELLQFRVEPQQQELYPHDAFVGDF